LVIDTCTFPWVFDENARNHHRFIPILKWLMAGRGKIIFGGSKYKKELRGTAFKGILIEFERRGKLVRVPDGQVDKLSEELKNRVPDWDFDDEHLVALVSIMGCCAVCTDDKRAVPYLKRRDLYPPGIKPPKIYRYANHGALCRNEHIVPFCR
jgi:hypothetical protein